MNVKCNQSYHGSTAVAHSSSIIIINSSSSRVQQKYAHDVLKNLDNRFFARYNLVVTLKYWKFATLAEYLFPLHPIAIIQQRKVSELKYADPMEARTCLTYFLMNEILWKI